MPRRGQPTWDLQPGRGRVPRALLFTCGNLQCILLPCHHQGRGAALSLSEPVLDHYPRAHVSFFYTEASSPSSCWHPGVSVLESPHAQNSSGLKSFCPHSSPAPALTCSGLYLPPCCCCCSRVLKWVPRGYHLHAPGLSAALVSRRPLWWNALGNQWQAG